MKRKEFCNELVNQFNFYAKNRMENPSILLHILILLASISNNNNEYNYYCDKIENQYIKNIIMQYYLNNWR